MRAVHGYVVPRVERFMSERGMTQKEFAEHVFINPSRMNRVLGGPENWTLKTLAKLLIGIEHDPRKMIAVLHAEPMDQQPSESSSDAMPTFDRPLDPRPTVH